ncbi:MAG: sensor histidine kinase [Anaerolineae bacterium]|nr:sensor histidine kinase [Anaerolineae bacterium]
MPGKFGHIATLGVVIAVAFYVFTASSLLVQPWLTVMAILLVVYAVLGTIGIDALERFSDHINTRSKLLVSSYFGLLTALVLFMMSIAGISMVLLYPLFSQAILTVQRRTWVGYILGSVLLATGLMLARQIPPFEIASSLMSFASGVVFVAGFTIVTQREAAQRAKIEQLAAELRSANAVLAHYASQVEQLATMQERNRLAREIHDTLGHYLTALSVQLEAARALLNKQPEAVEPLITKAQTLARDGLSEVRRSVAALRAAPTENKPLPDALRELVAEAQASGLDVAYRVEGNASAVSAVIEMTLYRAVQEGLTNIRKHANATRAEVVLAYAPNQILVRVKDNGSQPSKINEAGFGLIGLRERTQLLNGQVRSGWQNGFMLEVSVPR